jgi:Phage integrase family.
VYRYASRVYGIANCLEGIVMPKRIKPKIVLLSKSEQSRLMAYLNGDFDLNALGIALSLHTGIRIGELCALQWKDRLTSVHFCVRCGNKNFAPS